jgi:hypothetical protein
MIGRLNAEIPLIFGRSGYAAPPTAKRISLAGFGRIKDATERGKDWYLYCQHEDERAPWVWADRLFHLLAG